MEILLECDVFNGETLVGTLKRFPGTERMTVFEYDSKYEGPSLNKTLPIGLGPISSNRLHPFFCNLLSEGWLELLQKAIISRKHDAPSRIEMLAYFGADCPGALRVISKHPLPPTTVEEIELLSRRLARRVHASIPGVQPKVLAVWSGKEYVVSNGNKPGTPYC